MSSTTSAPAGPTRRTRLPDWLAARPDGQRDPASRDVRAIETTILLLVGLLLAVAVVYDVAYQTRVNIRESADRATWRAFAHIQTKHLSVLPPERGTTDIVCRSSSTVAATAAHQVRVCLVVSGPTVHGLRHIDGGFYLQPKRSDSFAYRYGCFGLPARTRFCGATSAAGAGTG